MEKEFFIQVKKDKAIHQKKTLYFIGLIKYISLIIIIRVHIHSYHKELFYAIRACELLFISSGFLVGYNYIDKENPNTFIYAFKYYYKHLRNCYPLYLINFFSGVINHKNEIKYNLTSIELFLINIFMLQVWSRRRQLVSFFNGISWFLHDLLICYFFSPLLLNGINSIKKSLILFLVFALTRILLEEFIHLGALNIFDTHIHDGPFVRIIEFYLGMLIIPTFLKFHTFLDRYKNKTFFKIILTIFPILMTAILFSFLKDNKTFLCCYYVLIFCLYIFIIGYEYGYLPDLISNKLIRIIMNPQMEMYLSHISINRIIKKSKLLLFFFNFMNKEFKFIIKLLIIFLFSMLYKILLKDRLSKCMDKLLYFFNQIIN